jgi:hypothetical protein
VNTRIKPAAGVPDGVPTAGPPAVFRCEGDYWTIIYTDRTVGVRDMLGMRYLGQLLARPHQPLPVAKLVAAVKGKVRVDAERARSAVSKRTDRGHRPARQRLGVPSLDNRQDRIRVRIQTRSH